jgi:L-lactate utilization protein LutB
VCYAAGRPVKGSAVPDGSFRRREHKSFYCVGAAFCTNMCIIQIAINEFVWLHRNNYTLSVRTVTVKWNWKKNFTEKKIVTRRIFHFRKHQNLLRSPTPPQTKCKKYIFRISWKCKENLNVVLLIQWKQTWEINEHNRNRTIIIIIIIIIIIQFIYLLTE